MLVSYANGLPNPITDCLTAIQCIMATLTLNRPIYVGISVLYLSKLHMYNFHDNHMWVKYPRPDQLRLLFRYGGDTAVLLAKNRFYCLQLIF